MNNYIKEYQRWLGTPNLDEDIKNELLKIKNNDEEIKDRFYNDLTFGTAGLRGILGGGTNRMNDYVVARATKAFGMVIKNHGEEFA
ncbi:MAG TPA: phospho-sugar mutase, partial [Clostridiales bacterium]|nr:phospho-sugar mutase [Clostridiales bacterium]